MNDKQTKMERYQEMQAMVQKEIEKMFPKLYSQEATKYGVAATPFHQHNGLDSPQISQDNVILTNKLITQLVSDESEEFTLLNVSNVSRISFHGFAFDSSSSPATKKASITGEIIFGKCNAFSGTGSTIAITTTPPGVPFLHTCSFTYLDPATPANSSVGTSPSLALATNLAGTEVASLVLDTYGVNYLKFTLTLAVNWNINGIIIIE